VPTQAKVDAVAVYRVGQDSKLWFIHLLPQSS